MTVRILTVENDELEVLAEEYPKEASVIEAMLKEAESENEGDEKSEREQEP
jgi:hypothetical protein